MQRNKLSSGILGVLLIAAILIWAAVFSHPAPRFEVWFLDVGQGDATYMRFPDGRDALIDGGPGPRVLTELGEVMPFYDHELDLVVVTHNHSDHISGLLAIAERYEIKEVWMSGAVATSDEYAAWLKILKEKQLRPRLVAAGDDAEFAGVRGKVLHPTEHWKSKRPGNQHEATVVTHWLYGNFGVLITGDLEETGIQTLASNPSLKATIFKVPHHGSRTGTSDAFLKAAQPEVAVISVGKGNRYGHPAASVINMLKKNKIGLYRTDIDGRIGFSSDGSSYQALQ